MSNKVKLSSPWVTYFNEIKALFSEDPDIKVIFDEESKTPEVKLYVNGQKKVDALEKLLPKEKVFGNVIVRTTIIPANLEDPANEDMVQLFSDAFAGNPVLSRIKSVAGDFSFNADYLVFKKKVVQFFNDDLSDVDGKCSTLYQDIAKDVFGSIPNVYFCTDAFDDNID